MKCTGRFETCPYRTTTNHHPTGGFETRPYEDAASFCALGVTNSSLVHKDFHAPHYFRRLHHDLFG